MIKDRYILGLDLGQQNDYSVLSVVRILLPDGIGHRARYEVPFIKRYQLKTNYSSVVEDVSSLINSIAELEGALLVVDYTGVGRPVVDLFKDKGKLPLAINITGGAKVSWPTKQSANVPKREIVSYLQIVLQNGRLKIAKELPLIQKLVDEFLAFKIRIVDSGKNIKSSMEGAYGLNDDIVMSLGIAIWTGEYFTKKSLYAIGGN